MLFRKDIIDELHACARMHILRPAGTLIVGAPDLSSCKIDRVRIKELPR